MDSENHLQLFTKKQFSSRRSHRCIVTVPCGVIQPPTLMLPNKLHSYLTVNKSMRYIYYALSYVEKRTYMNTCVLYSSCFCDKIPWRKQFNRTSVCLGSRLQTTFHPDGEIRVERAWGGWSHHRQSSEAKRGACVCSLLFSFGLSPEPQHAARCLP